MKNKKYIFLTLILTGLLCFNAGTLLGITDEDKDVLNAAQAGLTQFLESIPIDELSYYGFESEEELTQATVGTPFRVYTIFPQDLELYEFPNFLDDIIRETPLWFAPVMVNGTRRAILTVTADKGGFEAVGLSGTALASELNEFYSQLPEMTSMAGIGSDYTLKFVRIFQATSDFIFIYSQTAELLKPLISARMSLNLEFTGLFSPPDVLPKLKERVRSNIK